MAGKFKMFRINDAGASHYIIAPDAAKAMGEFVRELVETGMSWPKVEPEITEVPAGVVVTVDLQNELATPGQLRAALRAGEWCAMIPHAHYLACSDY